MIPLSPLDLGEILGGAFSTLGRYWAQVLGVALVVYGAAFVVSAGALGVTFAVVGDHLSAVVDTPGRDTPAWDDVQPLIVAFGSLWVLLMVVLMVATAMMQTCCPLIVQEAVLGGKVKVGTVLLRALPRVPAVMGTVFLSGLIALVPVLLFLTGVVATMVTVIATGGWDPAAWLILLGFVGGLVLAPLAIWLWVRFSLAPAVVVIESRRPVEALRRSAGLVRGSWWRICGISLLAFVIASIAGLVLQQVLNVLGALPDSFRSAGFSYEPTMGEIFVAVSGYLMLALVGQLISQIFSTTFPQLVLNLLYIDQRIRKEDLAPSLISAATAATATTAPPPGSP
ncbi:oxidoreductase [Streptomyces sp. NPDC006645]|uniref:oxidoreductase n=1 Tax=unclassified Streptomyces TaxID=2593676 RepID=UPI0033B391CA